MPTRPSRRGWCAAALLPPLPLHSLETTALDPVTSDLVAASSGPCCTVTSSFLSLIEFNVSPKERARGCKKRERARGPAVSELASGARQMLAVTRIVSCLWPDLCVQEW